VSLTLASSSERASAPANDSERSSTVTGCGLAARAAATIALIVPRSDAPATIPISSPRLLVLRALALNSAALRALARNSRSRWLWMTLTRICGKRAASASRSGASSSSVRVSVLANTVAVRSVPVIASCAPITSPLRIRSSNLTAAGGRARAPVHQTGGDHPDPVTRLARSAQLLAGREPTWPHLTGNGFELGPS